jgi:hypothetical protein
VNALLNNSAGHHPLEPEQPLLISAQEFKNVQYIADSARASERVDMSIHSVSAHNSDPPRQSERSGVVSSSPGQAVSDESQLQMITGGTLAKHDPLPPLAAGLAMAKASQYEATGTSVPSAGTARPSKKQPVATVAEAQVQKTATTSGQWVINLISSRSEAEAERFRVKAVNQSVAAVLSQVAVKGKDYWRVQVPG